MNISENSSEPEFLDNNDTRTSSPEILALDRLKWLDILLFFVVMAFGSFGNIFGFCTLFDKSINITSTFVYVHYLTLLDTIFIIYTSLCHILDNFFILANHLPCPLILFVYFCPSYASVFILAWMNVERFISMTNSKATQSPST